MGERLVQEKTFPCEGCGADLTFHIGIQSLRCEFCGYEKEIILDSEQELVENDFLEALRRIAEQRKARLQAHESGESLSDIEFLKCSSCSAEIQFSMSLLSRDCPYCASPVQKKSSPSKEDRIPVDGVLAFRVRQREAVKNIESWIRSLWFAPDAFLKSKVSDQLKGLYMPYWSFDSFATCHYRGLRGDAYYVTVGSGKNRRTERRIRWSPASGTVQRVFDDVLVMASERLPRETVRELEPWPLKQIAVFNHEMLSGYAANSYEIGLERGFSIGKERMDDALKESVRRQIGGDEQKITSFQASYDAVTFKHVLLPVWILSQRYQEKVYRIIVNAGTGEVQGERPYSWVKIALAILSAILIAGGVYYGLDAAGMIQ